MKEVLYDDEGEQTGEDNIYEILEKPVEDQGDGTGQHCSNGRSTEH